jgi:hypothetical protein
MGIFQIIKRENDELSRSSLNGTQEKLMAWCAEDQSLRAETVNAASGSRFSIRVRTAMGDCQISYPELGVERVVVERKLTLNADQRKILTDAGLEKEEDVNRMLNGLIASRSSLSSFSLVMQPQMTLTVSHPVYIDGLTRHSFLMALAEVDHLTTMVDLSLTSLKSAARVRRETEKAINKSRRELQEAIPPSPEDAHPPTRRVPTSTTRTCSKCGAILGSGYRFCKRCGTPALGEVMPR